MTSIEWTDKTWNPITGCSKTSLGCVNCYAEAMAGRFWGDRSFEEVLFHQERLKYPLSWKKPRKIFVCSMGDLFHESVKQEWLDQIFAIMTLTPQHTYQVLTKRPRRMLEYASQLDLRRLIKTAGDLDLLLPGGKWELRVPIKNIWLGTSIENQAAFSLRAHALQNLKDDGWKTFYSCEPLLEQTNLHLDFLPVDWVIVGGESGSKAREFDLQWARSLRDQCCEQGVPLFIKQLGTKPISSNPNEFQRDAIPNYAKWSGDHWKFNSIEWTEWPQDLCIREFPA